MDDHTLNQEQVNLNDKKMPVKFLHNRFDIDLFPRQIQNLNTGAFVSLGQ